MTTPGYGMADSHTFPGGYRGGMDAADVAPPQRIPSASLQQPTPAQPGPTTGEEWLITHINALSNAVDDIWELLTAIGMKLSREFAEHPKSHPAVPGVRRGPDPVAEDRARILGQAAKRAHIRSDVAYIRLSDLLKIVDDSDD